MSFIFSDWITIIRILLIGTLAYLSLVLILRLFGKRVLAKMNAFDFLVTVALGSILATTVVSKDLTLIDGMIGFTLLIILQFTLAKLTMYSKRINYLVKTEPVVLFYKGQFDYNLMEKERILEEEIYQAIRSKGVSSLNDVLAVVLETTGDISILSKSNYCPEQTTLKNVSLQNFSKQLSE